MTRMDEAAAVARLVERARAGERAAGDALVRAFAAEVYGALFRIVGNHEDAEDLAQETFVRGLARLDAFRGEGTFGAWLLRIAVHIGRDHLRRLGRAPERFALNEAGDAAELSVATGEPRRCELAAGAAAAAPSSGADRRELELRLAAALERLPAPLRAALALRVLEGRDYADVAAALGVRPATARTQVMKARRLLERLLAPWLGERSSAPPIEGGTSAEGDTHHEDR
ncbi:MAG: sigma-70 family RNA polymerase sigma factor [Planctomycetota bacterium]